MDMLPTSIYQTKQIRDLERLAQERFHISSETMMQRAGHAAFDFLLYYFPQAKKIAVFCGSGNNGGDGYVLANLAHRYGLQVLIWQVGKLGPLKGEAERALTACRESQIPIQAFSEEADITPVDLIVDAICGIGLTENLRPDVVLAVEKINRSNCPVFAIDVPTGIAADTGNCLGSAVYATATMTFIGLKLGLMTGKGVSYTGVLAVDDLQLPRELFSLVEPAVEKLDFRAYSHYLKPRPRDWHKGLSGNVTIVGGELGFSGAPHMAALAALRVGAGLVTVATRPENAVVMNSSDPEIMCHGVITSNDLVPLIEKAKVIVLGPGLQQSPWAEALWDHCYEQDIPLVVDADGLNLLAKKPKYRENWVLTPHPGEAANLLHEKTADIQRDRLEAGKKIQKRYGGVCVLKGAGSLIISGNAVPALCDQGNPGMASAGMGDILSGVVAGLIAQGIPLHDAAKLGVSMHAIAGDLAAKAAGERGTIATDLLPYLHRLANPIG